MAAISSAVAAAESSSKALVQTDLWRRNSPWNPKFERSLPVSEGERTGVCAGGNDVHDPRSSLEGRAVIDCFQAKADGDGGELNPLE